MRRTLGGDARRAVGQGKTGPVEAPPPWGPPADSPSSGGYEPPLRLQIPGGNPLLYAHKGLTIEFPWTRLADLEGVIPRRGRGRAFHAGRGAGSFGHLLVRRRTREWEGRQKQRAAVQSWFRRSQREHPLTPEGRGGPVGRFARTISARSRRRAEAKMAQFLLRAGRQLRRWEGCPDLNCLLTRRWAGVLPALPRAVQPGPSDFTDRWCVFIRRGLRWVHPHGKTSGTPGFEDGGDISESDFGKKKKSFIFVFAFMF